MIIVRNVDSLAFPVQPILHGKVHPARRTIALQGEAHVMLRHAGYLLIALVLGPSMLGCTSIEQGRMGPWVEGQPLWASCKCSRGGWLETAIGRDSQNISFETGKNCGGDDENARNQWCSEKCQAANYQEGRYMFCLK
jgi:hypothetical protein